MSMNKLSPRLANSPVLLFPSLRRAFSAVSSPKKQKNSTKKSSRHFLSIPDSSDPTLFARVFLLVVSRAVLVFVLSILDFLRNLHLLIFAFLTCIQDISY